VVSAEDRARARLALTVGDPAGIGPEIVLRALALSGPDGAERIVYGPAALLLETATRLGLPDLLERTRLVDVPLRGPVRRGEVSGAGGHAAADAVRRAATDALAGRVDALVTAPLHKGSLRAAGHPWPGHTEMLAALADVDDVAMMFVGGGLRVALLTIHRALRSVSEAITPREVERVVRLVHRELPRLGAAGRRIAVCGVNPHAGEGGLFGREEVDVIAPVIEALRREGLDVTGPHPADALFARGRGARPDAIVAAYHDQGLIPVKLLARGRAVNVTLGLPFVRTSVDHGTAFDIAGRGIADPGSLVEAMSLAADLVEARRSADRPREGSPA
jgi:4-hydroxythreonine-4-phosphate dehydrogenase